MRNPAALSLARPQVVALLTLLCATFGWLSYLGLPRQENPELRARHAEITVYLPGAAPEKVERLVTKVLEERVAEVDDILDIFSASSLGTATMIVELEKSAPLEERLQEIRAKVQAARAELPAEASDPVIDTEVLRTNTMILALALERVPEGDGRGAALALRALARDLVRELERLPGVRSVQTMGLPEEEIAVAVDVHALSARGLTLDAVVDALARRNVSLPSGELELGGTRSSVETRGEWSAAREVAATSLAGQAGGRRVRLGDVGRVKRQLAEPEVLVRHDGTPAVSIALEMLDGGSAVTFGERIRAWMADASARLPHGFRLAVAADEPTYVSDRLARLFGSLRIGMVLVAVVTLLGMGWRAGSVVSISIPLSLVVAFGLMGVADLALHQLSIAAMVIGIGLVVDEAIVVADSIQRKVDEGLTPREAAVEGLGEIHLAILAGAATTVAAFIPLFLMQGDIGDFIRSIPLVVSLMLLGSVLVAHFVTPLLCVFVHERFGQESGGFGARATPEWLLAGGRAYRRALEASLRHPARVLTAFVAAFALSFVLVGTVLWPPAFFGTADRNQFLVQVRLAATAPVERTGEVVDAVGAWLGGQPWVESWTGFAGSEAPKFYYNEFPGGRYENVGMLIVNTRRSTSFEQTPVFVDALNDRFQHRIPGAWVRARALKQGYGGGSDIHIYLQGDDLDELRALTRRVAEIARAEPGVVDVNDSFGYESLTLAARLDEHRARSLGISHRDVAGALRAGIDGVVATHIEDVDEEIPVTVRLAGSQRRHASDLATLPVWSPVAGRSVPLGQLATIEPGFATGSILRFDRQREGSIRIDVEGRPIPIVTDAIEGKVAEAGFLPGHVTAYYYGVRKETNESFLSLARAAIVAVFLIYTILVIRFQSLVQPMLVVLAIPMALIGSVCGLAITGMPLSFTAFLGMIALTGIVVNDSIVLIDFINTLRGRGVALEDAIRQGARTRLRPVLMTSVTTVVGLLPLSVTGGDFWGPFGFAMIFGLSASTVLTLLILPTAYRAVERRRVRRRAAERVLAAV